MDDFAEGARPAVLLAELSPLGKMAEINKRVSAIDPEDKDRSSKIKRLLTEAQLNAAEVQSLFDFGDRGRFLVLNNIECFSHIPQELCHNIFHDRHSQVYVLRGKINHLINAVNLNNQDRARQTKDKLPPQNISHREIFDWAWAGGHTRFLALNAQEFSPMGQEEIAEYFSSHFEIGGVGRLSLAQDFFEALKNLHLASHDTYIKQILSEPGFMKSTILYHYEYFNIQDEEEILQALLKDSYGRATLAEYAEKMKTRSPQQIAEALLQRNDYVALTRMLTKDVDIDHTLIVEKLIEQHNYTEIIKHLRDFEGVDMKHVLRVLRDATEKVAKQDARSLRIATITHLDLFRDYITDDDVAFMLEDESNDLFANLDKLNTDQLSNVRIQDAFDLLQEAKVVEYINLAIKCGNFRGLRHLLILLKPQERQRYMTSEALKDEFRVHAEHRNWHSANELGLILQLYGIASEVDDRLLQSVQSEHTKATHAETQHRRQRERFPIMDIRREALLFYINQYLLSELEMLDFKMTHTGQHYAHSSLMVPETEFASLRDKGLQTEMLQHTKTIIERLFLHLRQYTFTAICHESTYAQGYSFASPGDAETHYSNLQLREYLWQAKRIYDLQDNTTLGGKRWGAIAEVDLHAWRLPEYESDRSAMRNVNERGGLVDKIFQLEHNNGNIFNKDPRICFRDALHEVLNLKFAASSFEQYIEYGQKKAILSKQEVEVYRCYIEGIEKLKEARTKVKTD